MQQIWELLEIEQEYGTIVQTKRLTKEILHMIYRTLR